MTTMTARAPTVPLMNVKEDEHKFEEKKIVKANEYDPIAKQYQDSKKLSFRKYVEEYTLFHILGGETAGARDKTVLDIACGEGIYARKVKTKGGAKSVLGVDLSMEMVQLARAGSTGEDGCEYVQGDALDLGVIGAFDIVMGMYLLNYARRETELFQMCQAAYNNLRPGGRFLGFNDNPMNDPSQYEDYAPYGFVKKSAWFASGATASTPRPDGDAIHYTFTNPDGTSFQFYNYYLSPETYRRCFEAAGFTNFQWEGPFLDPAVQGDDFWNGFMNEGQPPMIGFSATRE